MYRKIIGLLAALLAALGLAVTASPAQATTVPAPPRCHVTAAVGAHVQLTPPQKDWLPAPNVALTATNHCRVPDTIRVHQLWYDTATWTYRTHVRKVRIPAGATYRGREWLVAYADDIVVLTNGSAVIAYRHLGYVDPGWD